MSENDNERTYEVCKVTMKDGAENYLFATMRNIHLDNFSICINEDGERSITWIFPVNLLVSVEWLSKTNTGQVG